MSASDYAEVAILNTFRGTPFSVATVYVQLHTGDPGETGTANVAANNTRKSASFAAPVSGAGTMDLSATIQWLSVPNTETYAYISLWDALTTGNCLGSGAISPSVAVTAGGNFTLAGLTVTAA